MSDWTRLDKGVLVPVQTSLFSHINKWELAIKTQMCDASNTDGFSLHLTTFFFALH